MMYGNMDVILETPQPSEHTSDMLESISPCLLLPPPPCATKTRITHVTAIFSDEWNWNFSPRNMRSRRRRFLNSGETISGFTAIFCDDWKDDIDEEEDMDEYIWPSKRAREEDVDFFAPHWDASQPDYKRQRLEYEVECLSFLPESPESQLSPPANSPPESLSFTATSPESQTSLHFTSPEPQVYQFDEFDSEKWPTPPGALEWNVNSRLEDSNEEELLTPGFLLSEDLLSHVPTLLQPPSLDIAALDKVGRDIYLTLISDEGENSATATTNLNSKTRTSIGDLYSGEEVSGEQWSQKDGCHAEPEGFEFWDDFLKCCMSDHGDHKVKKCQRLDASKEPRFEL
jgi:hypothetical protein